MPLVFTVMTEVIYVLFYVLAAVETETVKKQYTKVADAYGCLGVLNLGGCTLCYSWFFLLIVGSSVNIKSISVV